MLAKINPVRNTCKLQMCVNFTETAVIVCSNCEARYKRNRERKVERDKSLMEYKETGLKPDEW